LSYFPLSALAILGFGGGFAAAESQNELRQMLQSGLKFQPSIEIIGKNHLKG